MSLRSQAPNVLFVRGMPVMLDDWVAEAFDIDKRELNQAVSRNPEKFSEIHALRLSRLEWQALISQGVISKPAGRGGNRKPPMVYTQKGVARLATVLTTPRALAATDLIIDVFMEVQSRVAEKRNALIAEGGERLLPSGDDSAPRLAALKEKLIGGIERMLDIQINPRDETTVRDEMSAVTVAALDDLKAWLKTRTLANDKVVAETLLILEDVKRVRQETLDKHLRSKAETRSIELDNLEKEIRIARESLQLIKQLEASPVVALSGAFLPYQDGVFPALTIITPPDEDSEE